MNREEAVVLLSSQLMEQRLSAARFFLEAATIQDLEILTRAQAAESVPWVRNALRLAILSARSELSNGHNIAEEATDVDENSSQTLKRDAELQAIEQVASTMLHEFAAIVGSIRLSAARDISDYDKSTTRKLLEQLSSLVEAVRSLNKAASVPEFTEFDLGELVDALLVTLPDCEDVSIRCAGDRPFVVRADRNSMNLALVNGLRNAVEAVKEFTRRDPPQVILNWGRAGTHDWLVVVDSGQGFKGDPQSALRLGATNKRDHIGYGLATAQFAMKSMQGDLLVSNEVEGGARFEMRWRNSI